MEISEQLNQIRRNNDDVSLLKHINMNDISSATKSTLKVALKVIQNEIKSRGDN